MLSLTLEHTQNRNRERTSLAPVLDLTPSYSLKNTQQNTHTAARVNSVNTLAINSNSQYIQIYILQTYYKLETFNLHRIFSLYFIIFDRPQILILIAVILLRQIRRGFTKAGCTKA